MSFPAVGDEGYARVSDRVGAGAAPRRAIVLGAGGVLGFAWTLGALTAMEELAGFDARDVDLVIGTSAGSVGAALLGCGLSVQAISRHHQGIPAPEDPVISYDHDRATGSALPPRPGLRPAAPGLVVAALRHPRRISPWVAFSGLLPTGRGSLAPVHDLVDEVARAAGLATRWPAQPRPWIVAVDFHTGRRIVFGREDWPGRDGRRRAVRTATLADAVTASCSIPAWYPPLVIDGIPYVDGGSVSTASVDLLRDRPLDEVYVLAPMASLEPDRPRPVLARLERRVRRLVTAHLLDDVAALRARGVRTTVLTPGPDDLAAMGFNLMDPGHRTEVFDTSRETSRVALRRQLRAVGVVR
jgi:NTE family protein